MRPFLVSLAMLAATFAAVAPAAAQQRPNILFIAIDDLNDWVGPLGGHPQVKTPHMDRLARRGTTFLNAHTQAPLCNPSRTALMTGLRPSTTGVYGLAPWFREVEELKDLETLPNYLSKHGYRTYSTGKIFHGGYGRKPTDHEFDELGPPASVGPRPEKKLVNTPAPHPLVDWGVFPHKDEDKGDWLVASWAVEQLEKAPQEPFFLSAGFFLPHVPCYVTQKWWDLYPEDKLELPAVRMDDRDDTPRFSWYMHWKLPEPRLKFLIEANQWKNLVRAYLASISFVDSQVGRVLDALEASGHADDTIVVLWSDHGWHLGEKLITGKNTLWDESARVPLIFAGPGVGKGQKTTRPAELIDMYPTLVELAGLPPKEGLDGISLGPQLRNPRAPRERPAITTHNHDNHGVRSEDWRYIVYADGSEELYNLRKDPNEWTNLAKDPKYAEVIEEHRRWLPKSSKKPVPGSKSRILIYENGVANWEEEDIGPNDPVPEL
ncbi:MAG: sulfatase-like hydrolase/transferase [Acidobacteria bacterium]|nr:sulfatase-like hydrolase/transferase [Acidobacteriota bacterium]